MLRAATILFLVFVNSAFANTLRISEVTTVGDTDSEKMTLTTENSEEIHWVKKHAIISDKDVVVAYPFRSSEHSLAIELNEAAAERLLAKTKSMNHGKDKLATVIDGKLEGVYVLQSILHKQFLLYLPERNFGELQELRYRILGQTPPMVDPLDLPKPQKFETRPFTEEEYQQSKALRESYGIFYIDKVPLAEELDQLVESSVTQNEILKLLGSPTYSFDTNEANNLDLFYEIAPERLPKNAKRKQIIDGLNLQFRQDKLSFWSYRYSRSWQREKVLSREDPTLVATVPPTDMRNSDFNAVTFLESISVPRPRQQVNTRDLQDLVSLTMILSTKHPDAPPQESINSNSDFIKTLAHNFSEVQLLINSSNDSKLSIESLLEVITPYILGQKDLPTPPNGSADF